MLAEDIQPLSAEQLEAIVRSRFGQPNILRWTVSAKLLRAFLATLDAERARAKRLMGYTRHRPGCPADEWVEECTCGLDAALKEVGQP